MHPLRYTYLCTVYHLSIVPSRPIADDISGEEPRRKQDHAIKAKVEQPGPLRPATPLTRCSGRMGPKRKNERDTQKPANGSKNSDTRRAEPHPRSRTPTRASKHPPKTPTLRCDAFYAGEQTSTATAPTKTNPRPHSLAHLLPLPQPSTHVTTKPTNPNNIGTNSSRTDHHTNTYNKNATSTQKQNKTHALVPGPGFTVRPSPLRGFVLPPTAVSLPHGERVVFEVLAGPRPFLPVAAAAARPGSGGVAVPLAPGPAGRTLPVAVVGSAAATSTSPPTPAAAAPAPSYRLAVHRKHAALGGLVVALCREKLRCVGGAGGMRGRRRGPFGSTSDIN